VTPVVDDDDRAPASARWFAGALLALLSVPALIGFDAWPLTAWRLFSLSRDATETHWEVEAVAGERHVTLQLDEMGLPYRHAQWVLAELGKASDARREAVCLGLLHGARQDAPGATTLRILKDHARLVERNDEWVVVHDKETFHECTADGAA
jgi:hypothetical protein